MKRHLDEFVGGMPKSTDAWVCPYFIVIVLSGLVCVGFGVADGSLAGKVMAALAAVLVVTVTAMRKPHDEGTCSS